MMAFVTSNAGKFQEVREMLKADGVDLEWVRRAYPEIQADSLEEVVRHAGKEIRGELKRPFMIDDSGLFVPELRGFPGVYSSYVYRTLGCKGILDLLRGSRLRLATFECRLFLHDGKNDHLFTGSCPGEIAEQERGAGGFGFDPVFIPEGDERTFAEMSPKDKNEVSHRGRAAQQVIRFLKSQKS